MPINTSLNNIDAIILAGGLGTRLHSLISDRQKVIAEVNGKPFVLNIIDLLVSHGIRSITFALGHKAAQAETEISQLKSSLSPTVLNFSKEQVLLGTGGAIKLSSSYTKSDPVLVMNGDSYCPVNFKRLLQLHYEKSALATLTITAVEDASRYGTVTIDHNSQVKRFAEKSDHTRSGNIYINTGVYTISQNMIDDIPTEKNISLENEIFPRYVNNGLYGLSQNVPFIDIGTPESFCKAGKFLDDFDANTIVKNT